MSSKVDLKKLLEAGAHFGHKTSRWHPKMAPYIHSKRGGIHIIDLVQTADRLEEALQLVEKTVSENKTILVVGTKKQAKATVNRIAEETGVAFVSNRWLGGMLTNKNTISGRVKYLKDLEAKMQSGELESKYNKLELQRKQEEIDQLNFNYGGIKDMAGKPNLMFVFDSLSDVNAVLEANKLNIPVIALVDTNVDPTKIDYPVPCNDDATKTIELIGDYLIAAIKAGNSKQKEPVEEKKKD